MLFGGKALAGATGFALASAGVVALPAMASPTRAGDDPAFAETGLTSVPAIAGRGWSLDANLKSRYDTNILRQGGQQTQLPGDRRADFVITPSVSGAIAMPFGRQQLFLGGEIGRDFYARNTRLNRNRYSIGGGANLRAGSNCTGSVAAEYSSRQSLLSDIAVVTSNSFQRLSYGATANCQAPVGLGFGGTVQRIEQRNSAVLRQPFDINTMSFAPQVSYTLPVFGRFSLTGTYSQSRYINREVLLSDGSMAKDGVDVLNARAGFQRQLGTRLAINVGASYLNAKPKPQTVVYIIMPGIGIPTSRPAFSGIGYDASIDYISGGRLSAGLEARRTVSAATTVGSEYRVTQDYGFNADYKLGRSLSLGSGVTYGIIQYRGSFSSPLEPVARISDKLTRFYGSIDYTPVKLYTVGVEVSHQNRDSLPTLYSYKSTSVVLRLRVNFGRES
jgi:hypothetical protein